MALQDYFKNLANVGKRAAAAAPQRSTSSWSISNNLQRNTNTGPSQSDLFNQRQRDEEEARRREEEQKRRDEESARLKKEEEAAAKLREERKTQHNKDLGSIKAPTVESMQGTETEQEAKKEAASKGGRESVYKNDTTATGSDERRLQRFFNENRTGDDQSEFGIQDPANANRGKGGVAQSVAEAIQEEGAAGAEWWNQASQAAQPFRNEDGTATTITQNPLTGLANAALGSIVGMGGIPANLAQALGDRSLGYGVEAKNVQLQDAMDNSLAGDLMGINSNETFDAKNMSNEQIGAQLMSSALDVAGVAAPGLAAGRAIRGAGKGAAGSVGRTLLRESAEGALPEAGTELMQTYLDSVATGRPATMDDYIQAGVGGAVLGGMMQGAPAAVSQHLNNLQNGAGVDASGANISSAAGLREAIAQTREQMGVQGTVDPITGVITESANAEPIAAMESATQALGQAQRGLIAPQSSAVANTVEPSTVTQPETALAATPMADPSLLSVDQNTSAVDAKLAELGIDPVSARGTWTRETAQSETDAVTHPDSENISEEAPVTASTPEEDMQQTTITSNDMQQITESPVEYTSGNTRWSDTGRTGVTRKGVKGNSYDGMSLDDISNDTYNRLKGLNNYEVVQELSELAANKDDAVTYAHVNAIRDFVSTRPTLRMQSNVDSLIKTIESKAIDSTTSAAQTMRFAQLNKRVDLLAGKADTETIKSDLNNALPTGVTLSEAQTAASDVAIGVYNKAGAEYESAKKKLDKMVKDPNATKTDIKATATEVLAQEQNIKRAIVGMHIVNIDAIMNSTLPIKSKNAMKTEYINKVFNDTGVYMHNWIDSSMLSSAAGRIFDIASGLEIGLEAISPLTALIEKGITKKTGVDVGSSGYKGIRRGVNARAIELQADWDIRKDLGSREANNAFTRLVANMRNTTSTAVEFGDAIISGISHSQLESYYGEKYLQENGKQADSARKNAMAILDADNVGRTFRDLAALDQGLGKMNYGAKSAFQQTIKAWLDKIPMFDNHPTLKTNAAQFVNRYLFGFLNATKVLAGRGISRLSFGTPSFVKLAGLKKKLDAHPNSNAIKAEYALTLRRGLLDAVSTGVLGVTGFALASAGFIEVTGGYPDDPRERALWESIGKSPHSLRVGDSYIEIPRLMGAFGYPFFLGATIGSGMADDKPFEEIIGDAVTGGFDMIINASGTENSATAVIDTLGLINGETDAATYGQKMTGSALSAITPMGSGLNQLGKIVDPIKRDTYDPNIVIQTAKQYANKTPFKWMLPEKLDSLGQPVAMSDWWARLSLGQSSAPKNPTASQKEAERLSDLGIQVFPPNTRIELKNSEGGALKMDGAQAYQLQEVRGLALSSMFEIAIAGDYYKSLNDQQKGEYLRNISSNPTISSTVAGAAQAMGLDVKIGDASINAGLEASQQRILMDASMMPSAELRVKLEQDTKFAADYYSAEYANKEANGTLTDDDKNINENGALYKMERANFNNNNGVGSDVVAAYDNTTNSDIETLWSTDREKAMAVITYDALLAASGLSGSTSNRQEMKLGSKATILAEGDFELAYMLSSAQYNAKEAAGTLRPQDINWQYEGETSLGYQVARDKFVFENNVPVDLYQQYKSLSNTDWKGLEKSNPDLFLSLWELDVAMTAAGVSARTNNHGEQKYAMPKSGGGGGGRGGGGGGAGGKWGIGNVPTVAELRSELFLNRKGTRTETSTSVKGNDVVAANNLMDRKAAPTRKAGKGIKTSPTGYKAQNTVKYNSSKIRQPAMGEPYMSFLKGRSPQSNFQAQRKY
jgi:hypothetical protein